VPAYFSLSSVYGIYHFADNGGANPLSPYGDPQTMGPGSPPGTGTDGTGGGTGSSSEPIARNEITYQFFPGMFATQVADLLPGEKAFIDAQPLIQMVQAMAGAGLRNFSSGPDGSFMAWYPDYWGVDGKPAIFNLEDIELKDSTMMFSDDPLTTHVYVEGSTTITGQLDQMTGWLQTAGVATVENEALYQYLTRVGPGNPDAGMTGEDMMRYYGVRPYSVTMALAGTRELEFLLSCRIFMEKWAQRFQTTLTMTFMPELFPGMRIALANHNVTVYVTEVSHTCDFEQGFSTTATIVSPVSSKAAPTVTTPPVTQPNSTNVPDPVAPGSTSEPGPSISPIQAPSSPSSIDT
jgi:hypothetical protein